MKITCDNCAAKYSIADEKVKGKVFKIRCKKCSQIIVVRGTDDGYGAGGGEDEGYDAGAAGAGYGEQDAAVWHVVIGRDQVGPMTADELRDRFAAGEINVESYIWREGFSDWLRLTAVDDFADMGQSTAVAPAAAGGWEGQHAPQADAWAGGGGAEETQRADSAALFGASGQPQSQDLFATGGGDAGYAAPAAGYDAAPAGGGVFTSSPEPAAGGDLFAGAAAGPAADPGGGLFSEDPREQVPSDPSVPVKQMTGQRGENSVLFSLANLQSLAMGDGGGGGSARPEPVAPKAGMASGGGSGLIDIRAMAASAATSGGPAASPRSGSEESLPPMGGFGGPLASAPVLMPSSGGDRPGWLLPVVIGGSVVVLGLAITLVLVIALKKDPQPQTQVAVNTTGTAGGSATGAPTKDPAKPAVKAGGTTENATGTTPGTAAKKPDDPKNDKGDGKGDKVASNTGGKTKTRRHRGGRRTPRRGTTHRGTTHKPTRVAANTPAPRKKRGGKRDELDDLLDGAMGKKRKRAGGSKPKAAAPPPSSNLPDRLERHQIVKGMQGIKPSIKRCFDRFRVPGMAMVRVSIGGSGRVTRAKVTGLFAGTPTGACISGAVKSGRFARTKNPTTITYPFNLR